MVVMVASFLFEGRWLFYWKMKECSNKCLCLNGTRSRSRSWSPFDYFHYHYLPMWSGLSSEFSSELVLRWWKIQKMVKLPPEYSSTITHWKLCVIAILDNSLNKSKINCIFQHFVDNLWPSLINEWIFIENLFRASAFST